MVAGRRESGPTASELVEPSIYDVYRKEALRQFPGEARSNSTRRLDDIMYSLSPRILAELQATTYRPLPSEQIEINRKGYEELAQVVAALEQKRK